MTNIIEMRRTTTSALMIALSLMGLIAGSCGSDGKAGRSASATSGEIVVFAASSLTDAFTKIADDFTARNPEAKVTFNFAGSADLVAQIGQGAPADVFVSADDSNMAKLTDAGDNASAPVPIAANTFEIIVEPGNPQHVTGLADLSRSDLVVVLCAETVPCGKGAAKVLQNAAIEVTPKSYEDKVKGVVTKVTTGEADAGIVFVTDVRSAGTKAVGVEIPAAVNVISNDSMVVTKQAPNPKAAQAFVDFVASDAGQAVLAEYGFLAP